MESKGRYSFSTPLESVNQKVNNKHFDHAMTVSQKHQNQLRNITLTNKWNPKPLTNPNSSHLSSLAFQKLSELNRALREDNTQINSDETPEYVEKNLKGEEGPRPSPRDIARHQFFDVTEDRIGDTTNKMSSLTRRKLAPSAQTDTPRSRVSSLQTADDTFLHDTIFHDSSKMSSTLLANAAVDEDHKFSFQNNSTFTKPQLKSCAWTPQYPHVATIGGEINYIMLIGFFSGLLVSKALQYLQLYLCWFLHQILQLRNALLCNMSMWEFLNMDDNSRLNRRTKLFLILPIVACSLLNLLISILYFSVGSLLTTAPSGLIKFVNKLYN